MFKYCLNNKWLNLDKNVIVLNYEIRTGRKRILHIYSLAVKIFISLIKTLL